MEDINSPVRVIGRVARVPAQPVTDTLAEFAADRIARDLAFKAQVALLTSKRSGQYSDYDSNSTENLPDDSTWAVFTSQPVNDKYTVPALFESE